MKIGENNPKISFSNLSKDAPLWIQKTLGSLAIIQSAKVFLIYLMPVASEATKIQIGGWFDWILALIGVSIAVIGALSRK
jgi:hypothetical protein